ncbi:MAG: M16 family metallopeptidase [Bacillota bacterium]
MNRKYLIILMMVVSLTTLLIQRSCAKVDFSQSLYKKLAENKNQIPHIQQPDYKRIKLDNGVIVYLVEDHSLPTVELTGYINGGQRQEEREIAGISSLMFELMNTTTENYSEEELARYKELHGIDLDFNVQPDYFQLTGDALSTDQEALISLVAEILQRPNFSGNHFQRIKQEKQRYLLQAQTEQDSLLNMYFDQQIYPNHPYSFYSNLNLRLDKLANLFPPDLTDYYQQTIAPNNLVLGIVGDIDPIAMTELIKEEFSTWQQRQIEIREPQLSGSTVAQQDIIIVDKPDATQAKIKLGYNFFSYDFADRIAFEIANRVYGSGRFGSRLMKNLRSQHGYVYNISARSNYHQLDGSYQITTSVKPSKTLEAIRAITEEMRVLKEEQNQITEEELFNVINLYNAYFPKRYQTQISILDQLIYNKELRNRRPDYINHYIEQYNNLELTKVQKAFSQYTYPERLVTVIVANQEEVVPQFKEAGLEVQVVEE